MFVCVLGCLILLVSRIRLCACLRVSLHVCVFVYVAACLRVWLCMRVCLCNVLCRCLCGCLYFLVVQVRVCFFVLLFVFWLRVCVLCV